MKSGHLTKDCRNKNNGGNKPMGGKVGCYNCKKFGHLAKNCRTMSKNTNNNEGGKQNFTNMEKNIVDRSSKLDQVKPTHPYYPNMPMQIPMSMPMQSQQYRMGFHSICQ